MNAIGSDPRALREAAAQLDGMAASLHAAARSIHGLLFTTPWMGPFADGFRDVWSSRGRLYLNQAATELEHAAAALRVNADQQDQASKDGVSSLVAGFLARSSRDGSSTDSFRAPYRPFENHPGLPEAIRSALSYLRFGLERKEGWTDGAQWSGATSWNDGVSTSSHGWSDDPTYRDKTEPPSVDLLGTSTSGTVGFHTSGSMSTDGPIPVSASYDAWAGAQGHASATVGLSGESLALSLAAGGALGVGASGSFGAGTAALGASGSAEVFAGARGDASLNAKVGPDGATINAGVKAFAGGEASATIEGHAAGVSTGVTGHAYAGIGINAHADLQITPAHIKADIDFGVALGVGAGFDVKVDWNPAETFDAVAGTLNSIFHF